MDLQVERFLRERRVGRGKEFAEISRTRMNSGDVFEAMDLWAAMKNKFRGRKSFVAKSAGAH